MDSAAYLAPRHGRSESTSKSATVHTILTVRVTGMAAHGGAGIQDIGVRVTESGFAAITVPAELESEPEYLIQFHTQFGTFADWRSLDRCVGTESVAPASSPVITEL